MSGAVSASSGKPYGLKRAARLWRVSRSTVYAHRRRRTAATDARPTPRRPDPQGPCDDAALLAHIRRVLADSPWHGEGHRKVWARLWFQKLCTSKERVRRLMHEHGLQAPHRLGHIHGPKAHDRTIIPDRPNVVWQADLTGTVTTRDGAVGVFVAVDHHTVRCSAEDCVMHERNTEPSYLSWINTAAPLAMLGSSRPVMAPTFLLKSMDALCIFDEEVFTVGLRTWM